MAKKIDYRGATRLALIVISALIQGCAFTPGLQVKAGPEGFFRSTPTHPQEEDRYVLIPVTEELVAQMEAESLPKNREIPPEWRSDVSNYAYQVGPNDLLQVVVWDHPELSLQSTAADTNSPTAGSAASASPGPGIRVNPRGIMFFPFIGSIQVAGKTADEIREMIKGSLSHYVQDPQVDVRVVGFRSKKVQVAGEVQQPRDVPITDVPLRLLDAINQAGGIGSRTAGSGAGSVGTTLNPDLDDVRIIRNGKQMSFSLLDIYDRG
jgi:polysaccharide export outer membrane protein